MKNLQLQSVCEARLCTYINQEIILHGNVLIYVKHLLVMKILIIFIYAPILRIWFRIDYAAIAHIWKQNRSTPWCYTSYFHEQFSHFQRNLP